MLGGLKKILGIWTTSHSEESTEASLFSGPAYFSKLVPKAFTEKWVAHGGAISSGTTLDVRARYFFATDPSEPWVTKLFAKSVVVIHAGWIMHCVDKAFRVPISEYILDDRFVPGPPYKLTNVTPPMYAPLSEEDGPPDAEFEESGPTTVQTSDTPSTPTIMQRKRKREQAYFDSPSGSLVFSGFDKDGMPRRPRKQRKLRFDPSFSPEGRSYKETKRGVGLDWLWDHHAITWDNGFSGQRNQDTGPETLCGPNDMTTARPPGTPDKPFSSAGPFASCQQLSSGGHLSEHSGTFSPAIPIDFKENARPVRTIDFTNLPPPSRRWRFPQSSDTNARDTNAISFVKPTDHKVKTPKKISFANHAQVCVYMVSPRRPDAKDDAGSGPLQQCSIDESNDAPNAGGETRRSRDQVEDPGDSTAAEAIKDFIPQTDSPGPKVDDDPARLLGGHQFENDTLTLTMEDVQAMRCRLLESATKDDVDGGQLATLFELGKTFRGMTFRHVW